MYTISGRLYKRSRSEDNIVQNCESSSDEVFITAQIVAQVMRKDDPLYCPANANPFASIVTLKDGCKLFEIPRQRKFSSSSSFSSEAGFEFRKWESLGSCDIHRGQQSQSLPSSPIMLRKAAEKLHQTSLHGKETVQAANSRHDISLSLSSEGYESGGPTSWDGDASIEPDDAMGYEQEADTKRAKFNCSRTRSLGSLDFWIPPRRPKSPGGCKLLKTPGGDAHMALETSRPGFCNRVTSEIRESSLENIIERSSVVLSSTTFCGDGDISDIDNVTDYTSLAAEEESMYDASDVEDNLNGSTVFFSSTEKLQAIACHRDNSLVESVLTEEKDINSSNLIGACIRHPENTEDRMILVGCEPNNKDSDRHSMSSSSLSSYLSCSEMGEDAEIELDPTSMTGFSYSHLCIQPVRPHCPNSRQPLIERTLLVNSDAPVKFCETITPTNYNADTASLTPLIATESGSYDQNHFGQVANTDLAMKR